MSESNNLAYCLGTVQPTNTTTPTFFHLTFLNMLCISFGGFLC